MNVSLSELQVAESTPTLSPRPPPELDLNSAWLMDIRDSKPRYALSHAGSVLQVSEVALLLLVAARDQTSIDVVAADLGQQIGRPVTAAEVRSGYARVVEQFTALRPKRQSSKIGLWLRLPLLRSSWVFAISSATIPLFRQWFVVAMAICIPAVLAGVFLRGVGGVDPLGFAIAYVLFFASQLIHELGHAGAAKKQRIAPGEIGFAIYLIWPAFFTSLNQTWRLPRRKRALVDLGGVYLQLVLACCYGIVYLMTGWSELSVAIVLILITCGFNLLPIFRLDGYWLLADLLGIHDLDRQARKAVIAFSASRILRRNRDQQVLLSKEHSAAVRRTLLAYGAFTYLVWVLFAGYVLSGVWRYSAELPGLFTKFFSGQAVLLPLLLALASIAPLVVLSSIALRYAFRWVKTHGK